MICPRCGCYISFLLDYCPGCGEPKYVAEKQKWSEGNACCNATALHISGDAASNVDIRSKTPKYPQKVLCISQSRLKSTDMSGASDIPVYVADTKQCFYVDRQGTMICL